MRMRGLLSNRQVQTELGVKEEEAQEVTEEVHEEDPSQTISATTATVLVIGKSSSLQLIDCFV